MATVALPVDIPKSTCEFDEDMSVGCEAEGAMSHQYVKQTPWGCELSMWRLSVTQLQPVILQHTIFSEDTHCSSLNPRDLELNLALETS